MKRLAYLFIITLIAFNAFAQSKISTPTAAATATKEEIAAEINVKNADIAAIIRIFSRKTGRNYLLDERVKGKVTMYLPGKITPEESLRILDSVLALKGFTQVPISENMWKVVPSKEARQSTIPTVGDVEGDPSGAVVTKLITLKHVSSEEAQPLLQQLISADGLINAYAPSNSLLIIDYENNIDRIAKLIEELDVPFSNRDMVIIPIKNAEATDIADKLNELLGSAQKKSDASSSDGLDLLRSRIRDAASAARQTGTAGAQPVGMPLGSQAQNGGTAAGGTNGTNRSRDPKIIADERTNSIIVVADEEMIARIRALVGELDSEIDRSGVRFYVYRCQHAKADELADVLAGLVGQQGSGTGRTNSSRNNNSLSLGGDDDGLTGGLSSNRGSRSRGLNGRATSAERTQSRLSSQRRNSGSSRSTSGTGGITSAQLSDELSITADPATNSLVIHASKTEYEKIKTLIEELDVKRRQVLVEAMLLEVQVDDSLLLGTDFLTSTGGADGGVVAQSNFGGSQGLAGLLSDPTKLAGFSLAAASSGSLTIGDTITIPTQAIMLSAAQQNTNANILSSPTLLTTDNEEAEIVVGQNVPFLASSSTDSTNLNNTFNQIDRQDVGITMRITPQISSNDFVTLRIFTDVSNIVETANTDLGPTTNVRSSETTVITKSGQMIVIGGLIADAVGDANNGVPFLKDVPILGSMFRRTNANRRRANLLTFITPRIIKDQFDARDSTISHRNSIEERIQSEEFAPDRSELLRNVDIDRVTTEKVDKEAVQPGTILPPAKKEKTAGTKPTNAPLELSVKPELPNKPVKNEVDDKDQRAALKSNFYFIMKSSKEISNSANLPFQIGQDKSFGITIPAESTEQAKEFFQVGSNYLYGDHTKFQVVERHLAIPPDKQLNWYTLSPFEIMSLGKGPWYRDN